MYLTDKIFVSRHHPLYPKLDQYAFLCKNMFNVATYVQRQRKFAGQYFLSTFELINLVSKRDDVDYKAIPAKVSQQIIKQVSQNFKSYVELLKLYIKDPEKNQNPKLPRYLKKDGRANIILTKQAISKKDWKKGFVSLSSYLGKLSFPLGRKIHFNRLQEVKVVRCANGYQINITHIAPKLTYDHPLPKFSLPQSWGVDLGMNNLMTIAGTEGSFIISGRPVKSINQHFNKRKAKFQSALDLVRDQVEQEILKNNLKNLSQKRKNKIDNYFHQASRKLINLAVSKNVTQLVIGYNEFWKQGINLGKKTNQNFVYIPFLRLINMIQYKAHLAGIKVVLNEESYTSKCSFLDNEEICEHKHYLGKRIKRGLFKSSTGKLINADVNGALNILRKVVGEFEYDPIKVCSTPVRLKI